MTKPIIWSNGGGTQSAAIAVLISQGKLPVPERAVMADTSRECSQTWDYLENYLRPLLFESAGLEVEIVPHSYSAVDLYSRPKEGKRQELLLPVWTREGNGRRRPFCSGEWKRDAVYRYLREPERDYGPKEPIIQWLGFSRDEIHRCKPAKQKWVDIQWPLIMGYGLMFTRTDCVRIVTDAGLPKPPKSRCWMCPHQNNHEWRELRDEYPQEFEKALALDQEVLAWDERDGLYLHHSGVPLAEADLSLPDMPEHPLFGRGEDCDAGMCWI